MLILGFDPGNISSIGASIDENGHLKCRTLSSIIGTGTTNVGRLEEGVESDPLHRPQIPYSVQYTNGNEQIVTYLVGDGVERYTTPSQRISFDKLTGGADSPEMETLLYAVAGRVLPPGDTNQVGLVVGLPVPVLANESLTAEIMSALRGWVIDSHRITLNTKKVNVKIVGVAGIAQPRGSFYYWGLNNSGRWAQDKEALTSPVLIIDIGFLTVDLYLIENNQAVPRFTKGDTIGMKLVAENLQTQLFDEYDMTVSLHEADAYIRQYLTSKKPDHKVPPPSVHAAGKTDISHLCVQSLGIGRTEVGNFIQRVIGKRGNNFFRILLTGGGMHGFGKMLLQRYPRNSILLSRPAEANAIGQAKAGVAFQKKWFP